MQQQPDQTIHTYISELQTLWDQLAICDPVWPNVEATKVYADLRDRQHVWHLLMTVRDEFESVQSSLLHQSPLPKLDIVIKDLISEEIRLNTLRVEHVPLSTDMVLATHATQTLPLMFKHLLAKRNSGHNTTSQSSYKAAVTTAAIDESLENSSLKFSLQDIQALFQQLQPEHDYHMLKVFGSACFVLLQPHEYTKLESRERICCFLGYGIEHKGYRYWDPISKRLRMSRHVIITQTRTKPLSLLSKLPQLLRSVLHLFMFHLLQPLFHFVELLVYCEASSNPLWQQAMAEELLALTTQHTWDVVDLPFDKTMVGWFTQEYGIAYDETFAQVARLTSVRNLIAIAAAKQWKLFQMDVKNAFLNGDLSEEVYMQPPPRYNYPPARSNKLFLVLVPNLNIEHLPILLLNLFGYDGYFKIWASHIPLLLRCIVIIVAQCKLLIMMSSMNVLSTMKMTVTLFDIIQ
ncbi:Retrovirus-related Pol polyprotein from transposon TNT 1-94 [Sesamum angolense]|uniref:Retrovirus-related Pol polyprotein from transposon TNT 1-94 n=1 Tax=Sesamum angolense TaxID=2727404 RepID=A0AAE1TBN4_9LAMI|nr:Retrovirus-related Pol polyprotein from transposon TNT 1-94 [Sesamum angolense]